ncbi:MAG: hypothetical protein AAGA54_01210 [Myxococcota bacterium]
MLTFVATVGVWAATVQPVAAEGTTPAEAPPPVVAAEPAPRADVAVQSPTRTQAVSDEVWSALQGRQVTVEVTGGAPVQGELLRSDGAAVVVVEADGSVRSIAKTSASGVKVVQPPPAQPAASPRQDIASLDAPAEPALAEDPAAEDEDDELTAGEQRRKERREAREHALLGAFTMHGATYSHWRGEGVRAGGASYAMDWGVGFNFSKTFGVYAIAGGLFGARIDGPEDEEGAITETKANYGHVGGIFAFGGKWYYSTVGAGAAFSRLRFADGTLQKDSGLAIPTRFVARVPLPKKLYLGVGLTYEFAAVRNFGRFVNAIGGQIVFGRW